MIKGEVVRFQAAYVSDEEIRQIPERLRQGGRTSRRCPAEVLVGTGTGHTGPHYGLPGLPQPPPCTLEGDLISAGQRTFRVMGEE